MLRYLFIILFIFNWGASIFAQTILPDVIDTNTTLNNSGSPYFINSDLTINANATLLIKKDVEILIANNLQIIVYGAISAKGSIKNPVIFKSQNDSNAWKQINIQNATDNCYFENVVFYEGKIYSTNSDLSIINFKIINSHSLNWNDALLRLKYGKIKVQNSSFYSNNTGEGIVIRGGNNIKVENCNFHNVPDAIEFIEVDSGTIQLNRIYNSADDGIDLDASKNIVICKNLIFNCSDNGISIGNENFGGSNAIIIKNLISGCETAITVKDSSEAKIENNTLYFNKNGIKCIEKTAGLGGSTATVINTIISQSIYPIIFDQNSDIFVSYSLCDNSILSGLNNLKANPLFISTKDTNFHLQINSPCINSGDLKTGFDADSSRKDIGAFPFFSKPKTLVVNEINYNSLPTTKPGDWIELHNYGNIPIDVSHYYFLNNSNSFPEWTTIFPDSYLVVCQNKKMFTEVFPFIPNYLENSQLNLNDFGESILFYDLYGQEIDSVTYSNSLPWDEKANGKGPTLELLNPLFDNSLAQNWKASKYFGSPGTTNFIYSNVKNIEQIEIKIYPNPFQNYFFIEFRKSIQHQDFKIKIYDIYGRCIKNKVLENNCTKVSLEKYKSNIYFVVVFNKTEIISVKKILKN
ncbi:MAG: T9SS type A sorting domain-containing protein [Bacteroidota bacterium]|nr:T9SS type A sorting domain-containing protein [Bacteroidota bacterium]